MMKPEFVVRVAHMRQHVDHSSNHTELCVPPAFWRGLCLQCADKAVKDHRVELPTELRERIVEIEKFDARFLEKTFAVFKSRDANRRYPDGGLGEFVVPRFELKMMSRTGRDDVF